MGSVYSEASEFAGDGPGRFPKNNQRGYRRPRRAQRRGGLLPSGACSAPGPGEGPRPQPAHEKAASGSRARPAARGRVLLSDFGPSARGSPEVLR